VRSGGVSDSSARRVCQEGRAGLSRCARGAIDSVKQALIDRNIYPDGPSRQFHRHDGYDRVFGILDECGVDSQFFKGTQDWKRVAVFDHTRHMEKESLGATRKSLVEVSTTRYAARKVRKGNSVGAAFFVNERVGEVAHALHPISRRRLPVPARLSENRPQRPNGNVAHTHVQSHLAGAGSVSKLDVIARSAALDFPAFVLKPSDDLPRRHDGAAHRPSSGRNCCVYLHNEVRTAISGAVRA